MATTYSAYFTDTSALVKRHVIEVGSAWFRSLVRAKAAHDLYIARITAVEVTSAITRRQQSGHLSRAQGGAMLAGYEPLLARLGPFTGRDIGCVHSRLAITADSRDLFAARDLLKQLLGIPLLDAKLRLSSRGVLFLCMHL